MNRTTSINYIKKHRPAINATVLEKLSIEALAMIEIQVYLEVFNRTKFYN